MLYYNYILWIAEGIAKYLVYRFYEETKVNNGLVSTKRWEKRLSNIAIHTK